MSENTEGPDRCAIYSAINVERDRQQKLFGDRSIAGTLLLDTKLRILAEEMGEVAQAIDVVERMRAGTLADEGYTMDDALGHLREELIQVAACAVGWLEALR